MKRWHTLALGLLISAVALFFVIRQADTAAIVDAFATARYGYVALTAGIYVVLVGIRGWRWQVLTEGRLRFIDAFWLFNIGFLFNNLLPARLGELIRAMLAGRKPKMQFGTAVSTIVVERLFDMVAVVLMMVVALLILDLPPWATTAAAGMGALAVTGIGVLALAARRPEGALTLGAKILALAPVFDEEKARDFLHPFIDGLAGVSDLRVFAAGLAISIFAWFMSGVSGWTMMLAFWPGAPFIEGQLAVAGAGVGVAVPGAPSGVGPFHAAVVGVMVALGYNNSVSLSYATLLHAVTVIVTSALGVVGLLREGIGFNEAIAQARELRDSRPDEPTTEAPAEAPVK